MNEVRVDEDGEQRCWGCGGKDFTAKRPLRTLLLLGWLAMMTKKKLKCVDCGEYNNVPSNKVE